jgi:hypothetical protein
VERRLRSEKREGGLTSPQFFGLFNSLSSLSREIGFENNPCFEEDADLNFAFIARQGAKRLEYTSNPTDQLVCSLALFFFSPLSPPSCLFFSKCLESLLRILFYFRRGRRIRVVCELNFDLAPS